LNRGISAAVLGELQGWLRDLTATTGDAFVSATRRF
jgi:hypothetical protein